MKPQKNPNEGKEKKQAPGSREGVERNEPGKPTRGAPPQGDADVERIAKQQGTSQRGFGEDAGEDLPPDGPVKQPPQKPLSQP